jgi:hypothetical protein
MLWEVVELFAEKSEVLLQIPSAPHIDLVASEVLEAPHIDLLASEVADAPHTALAPHMHRVPLRTD